jgi:hypothetical protein
MRSGLQGVIRLLQMKNRRCKKGRLFRADLVCLVFPLPKDTNVSTGTWSRQLPRRSRRWLLQQRESRAVHRRHRRRMQQQVREQLVVGAEEEEEAHKPVEEEEPVAPESFQALGELVQRRQDAGPLPLPVALPERADELWLSLLVWRDKSALTHQQRQPLEQRPSTLLPKLRQEVLKTV